MGIGIENLLYFYKYRLFLQTVTLRAVMRKRKMHGEFCCPDIIRHTAGLYLPVNFCCKAVGFMLLLIWVKIWEDVFL